VLLVGMNPGPWGMAQTGVPFGAVSKVRGWLGLHGVVEPPARQHPKKRVIGYDCSREEVSGSRLWGWAEQTFGTPQAFFERFFVWNYCPLLFLDEGGRNVTPDRLRAAALARLTAPCDAALRRAVAALGCRTVVGVGDFAFARATDALRESAVRIGKILHPSPASPAANRGWGEKASEQLRALGIEVPIRPAAAPADRDTPQVTAPDGRAPSSGAGPNAARAEPGRPPRSGERARPRRRG
jgi:single-strand selective monofunctional uracil DNA glycosylase